MAEEADSCSLCHAKAVIDFTSGQLTDFYLGTEIPLTNLNFRLQITGKVKHPLLRGGLWKTQLWPVENSAVQLSVKSFLGKLERGKGKCRLSGCLVCFDLIRSFMFSCL